jgi:putative transposase
LELDSKVRASEIIIREKEGFEYVIDETVIKVGPEYVWIWIATIEAENKEILGISISKEQNMFVTERFLSDVVEKYGEHPVSSDGGIGILKHADS